MEIKLTLSLPRDEISIPVVRRICNQSLTVLGVSRECIGDVELALTEACANVLLHARDGDEYEVSAGVDDETAVIEVIDRGGGFEPASVVVGDVDSEHGRGIFLMRALMDDVQFVTVDGPNPGTRVQLTKRLVWEDAAPGLRLATEVTQRRPWDGRSAMFDAPDRA
jgi:serine/threonine-protein kinase RsbW